MKLINLKIGINTIIIEVNIIIFIKNTIIKILLFIVQLIGCVKQIPRTI